MNNKQRLRDIISCYRHPLKELTVLSSSNDPYRLDTPAGHEKGRWFKENYEQLHDGSKIHLRGLHYKFVGRAILPNGEPYINNEKNWKFLSENAAKCARYLGYIPWTAFRDARNAPPQVYAPVINHPEWLLSTGEVTIHLPDELEPSLQITGNLIQQPYQQIIIAEKSGVIDLLRPVCKKYQASLVTPNGEISDTLMYELLSDADFDGRPLIIHQLGDFDPAGHQMAISTSRTAQAMIDSQFPNLCVKVFAPLLTKQQCIDWNLPSTPLKETEKRGDKWLTAMGREQTELDAAIALAPKEFVQSITASLEPFFDKDIHSKELELRHELEFSANKKLSQYVSDDFMDQIRINTEDKLESINSLKDEINQALSINLDGLYIDDLPHLELINGDSKSFGRPLLDTDQDWAEQTRRLISRKRY